MPLEITTVVSAPYQENTYLVRRAGERDGIVIDPGFEPERLIQKIKSLDFNPVAILLTHGHVDHIAGNTALREVWPNLPILIGAGDAPMLTNPQLNLSAWGGMAIVSPPATQLLHEGDVVAFAGMTFDVRDIPGHSPGHIVYLAAGTQPLDVFGGDVLFQGSVGRTDFPGGNGRQLAAGIHAKLFTLPDDTRVHPGHGPSTTTGIEKTSNPFVGLRR